MKPEQQRIAIAEACGWKQCQWNGAYNTYKGVPPVRPSVFQDIPDYLNDLNAMHEAEKVIAGSFQWNKYTEVLANICHWNKKSHDTRTMANIVCSATASQRAEAFLKTLGLWK